MPGMTVLGNSQLCKRWIFKLPNVQFNCIPSKIPLTRQKAKKLKLIQKQLTFFVVQAAEKYDLFILRDHHKIFGLLKPKLEKSKSI